MIPVFLADGVGAGDQTLSSLLLLGVVLFAWIAVARLRARGFLRLPRKAAWASAGLAATCLVLAAVVPQILRPSASPVRPSTHARIQILSPTPVEVFHGDPAAVPIRLLLTGGRIVSFVSSKLVPDEGHVHVSIDGRLIFMSFGLNATVSVAPGTHRLEVEFVAVDHGPFRPPVIATAEFRVLP